MKRYKRNNKNLSLDDILNTERGRELVDRIEYDQEEVEGRGIDPNDTSEFWANALNYDIQALKDEFGYDWYR